MSRYHVKLTLAMIVALVDIEQHFKGDDSPARDHRTTAALERRDLVRPLVRAPKGAPRFSLTPKGKAYLDMALFEYDFAEANLKEAA